LTLAVYSARRTAALELKSCSLSKPNTSAQFLLGKSSDPDRLREEMKPLKIFVATTTIPEDAEEQIKEALKR